MADILIKEANQVNDEILRLVFDIVDGWYPDGPIDWEDLLDRVDRAELSDGSIVDLGDSMISPAIKKIKREVRKYRSQG